MNRSTILTIGKKLNGDRLHLLSVLDLEPAGIIVQAYNQADSKEYMLPITEIELAKAGYSRTSKSLMELLDTIYFAPLGNDWVLQSSNANISMQKTRPVGDDLEELIKYSGDVGSIHDLLVTGLVELCKVKPVGLDAVGWLGEWLLANNPNKPRVEVTEDDDE